MVVQTSYSCVKSHGNDNQCYYDHDDGHSTPTLSYSAGRCGVNIRWLFKTS